MSNKKLFWTAFFILSCCEFGQVAYSKNLSVSYQANNLSGTILQCFKTKTIDGHIVFNGKSTHYLLLPR